MAGLRSSDRATRSDSATTRESHSNFSNTKRFEPDISAVIAGNKLNTATATLGCVIARTGQLPVFLISTTSERVATESPASHWQQIAAANSKLWISTESLTVREL